jgi:hypothetical protein
VKKFLFAAAAAAAMIVVEAPGLALAQNAAPPPEAFPPYAPDKSSLYWSYGQLRHDYSDIGDCQLVRERVVSPSGRVTVRTRRDCD